jgi:putative membrane protein
MKNMKLNGMQALAGACCLLVPIAMRAQTPPSDPSSTMGSPASVQPSPTSSQTAPGSQAQHQYPAVAMNASFSSGMGAASGDDAQIAKDKMFLKDASQGGMSEVEMGQLASDKASSPRVKAFGQRMVTDHTELNNELKPFADKMGVPPPSKLNPEDQAELDKLNGLSGADFDKEYVAYMMKDHAKDLQDFKKEAANASDPDLKTAVMKGEHVIEQHKRMIDRIGASMSISAS